MSRSRRSPPAKKAIRTKGREGLHRAGLKAVAGLPKNTLTHAALSRQARESARNRGPGDLARAARKGARTRARKT
jgi:hypothetical protein